jgi:hypothetical protein
MIVFVSLMYSVTAIVVAFFNTVNIIQSDKKETN